MRALAAVVLAVLLQTAGAPAEFAVALDTSQGRILIAVHPAWAPLGAARFHELVASGYYDGVRFTRVISGKWTQFGINGDPAVAKAWRTRTIPDDPWAGHSNVRGTVAFAFKDPNSRTTQVFINTADNSASHDKEPFIVFGEVVQGMTVVDALYSGYGETAGGGIRAGHQDPVFDGGSRYLMAKFPLLDVIRRATIVPER